jgi:hypothetical protein
LRGQLRGQRSFSGRPGPRRELGINLQTATPGPEAVAEAVRRPLDDSEVRENVQQIAKVYAEHEPIDAIERLLPS